MTFTYLNKFINRMFYLRKFFSSENFLQLNKICIKPKSSVKEAQEKLSGKVFTLKSSVPIDVTFGM